MTTPMTCEWNTLNNKESWKTREIIPVDVTCREWDQSAWTSMNKYEKAVVALALKNSWIPAMEIWFPANPIDYENTKFVMNHMWDWKWKNDPIISVLGRAHPDDTRKSLEILKWYDKPRIHIFIATSDKHLKEKFWKWKRSDYSIEQLRDYAISQMKESIEIAIEFKKENPNLEIEVSLEDATNTEPEFFKEFISEIDNEDITCINLPDTMWVATEDWIESMFNFANWIVRHAKLSTHNHNDRWIADLNSIIACKNWSKYVETTLWWSWEWPWNSLTTTIVNNFKIWDIFDDHWNNLVVSDKIISQELWFTNFLFNSIVTSNRNRQIPFVWEWSFEDSSWVHWASRWCYRDSFDKESFWHVAQEEFFSARWWMNQVIRMFCSNWVEMEKNSPELIYYMRNFIKKSEKIKFLYASDMYREFLETSWKFEINDINLFWKKVIIQFTYNWQKYVINWEWGDNQWFIDWFMSGISEFLWEEFDVKLLWINPSNKKPLRDSVAEYIELEERSEVLKDDYKKKLMDIVEMSEKNDFSILLRAEIDRLILDWTDINVLYELNKNIDLLIEKWDEKSFEDYISHSDTLKWNDKIIKIWNSFKLNVSEYKSESSNNWWDKLWICTSEIKINWEKVHSTVSDNNIDHATLESIFNCVLPSIIKKLEDEN